MVQCFHNKHIFIMNNLILSDGKEKKTEQFCFKDLIKNKNIISVYGETELK